jgi:hypothetical protein
VLPANIDDPDDSQYFKLKKYDFFQFIMNNNTEKISNICYRTVQISTSETNYKLGLLVQSGDNATNQHLNL